VIADGFPSSSPPTPPGETSFVEVTSAVARAEELDTYALGLDVGLS
jgi:hypothetical protein